MGNLLVVGEGEGDGLVEGQHGALVPGRLELLLAEFGAGAGRVEVSVRQQDDRLLVDVRDDGLGGAAAGNGSGLIGMADRVSVLGGKLEIASPSAAGTLVHAEIPCG